MMSGLWTTITAAISIGGGLVATLLATYLPRRTVVESSRKAFIFALKDYDNTFSKLLNETEEYIMWALILQGTVGLVTIFILSSIPHASPTFLMYAIMCVILALMIGRVFAPLIIYFLMILMIKPKGSEPKGSIKSALYGIINDARAAVFTAVLASLLMLSKLVSTKLPWQSDLMSIIALLVGSLIVAYFPTILDYLNYYYDDDERIPWDLELVNRWLSVPDIRGGDSMNGSPFVELSLDNGQKLEGRLARVKKWGMILEDASKRAKLYIRWERIAAVELMTMID